MKYSEIKAKLKILKKHGFRKFGKGFPFYRRDYRLNDWHFNQVISENDILYFRRDLDNYCSYLYEKNMKLLLQYTIEDYTRSINFKQK